jgi:predicted esterase
VLTAWTAPSGPSADAPESAAASPLVDDPAVHVRSDLEVSPPPAGFFETPANPQGVIYLFHGGGGAASDYLVRVEGRALVDEALDRGFAVVAMDSADREHGKWTPPARGTISPDLARFYQLRFDLHHAGIDVDRLPEIAIGISNGGGWVSYLGMACPEIDGIGILSARGQRGFLQRLPSDLPVVFAHTTNDPKVPAADVADHHSLVYALGIPTIRVVKSPEPLTVERLLRIPDIRHADVLAVIDRLNLAGWLDPQGYLPRQPDRDSGWARVLPEHLLPWERDIGDQLQSAYAGHALARETYPPMFDFFADHIRQPSVAEVIR